MRYVTIKNRSGKTYRFFAHTEGDALPMALGIGFIRKVENGKITKSREVCSTCFPHTGWASLEVAPVRGYRAGRERQHSDELHEECYGTRLNNKE